MNVNAVRAVVAVVLAIAFIAFAAFLVFNADTTNATEWQRWVYVFGAAEAVAFTAVGWLFGREVNRKRAETAEARANDAEQQKDTAVRQGTALAGMIVAGAPAGTRARLEPQGASGQPTGLQTAIEYAKKTYNL
jgi:cytochrome bd-type quinol oxidase subunit 1